MILKKYKKIKYVDLPAKVKETYNFQKASAILADYGFITNLLKYDWNGADFLAQHLDGDVLKVQLKGRVTAFPNYLGKELFIMFEYKPESKWYLYPHDEFFEYCGVTKPEFSLSTNGFDSKTPAKWIRKWLEKYSIN